FLLNAGGIYFPAAVAQCMMLNEPLLLFIALVNMPVSSADVLGFNKVLRGLIVVEFVLGLIQFPIFLSNGESETIVGTLSGNAEQYTGFLLLGVCYYIGLIKLDSSKKKAHGALILGMLVLIPFVDNKASWFGVAVALYFLMTKLGHLSGSRMKYIFL